MVQEIKPKASKIQVLYTEPHTLTPLNSLKIKKRRTNQSIRFLVKMERVSGKTRPTVSSSLLSTSIPRLLARLGRG